MNIRFIYNFFPIVLQNLSCSIYGYYLKKNRFDSIFECFSQKLLESAYWGADKIINYKEEEIYKILVHAYNTCPYYKKKYDVARVTPNDFKSLQDLEKFPVLTKEEIRRNWQAMLSSKYETGQLIRSHTSGSSGKALDFYRTAHNDKFWWATIFRMRSRFCIHMDDLHLNFTGKAFMPSNVNKPPYWRYNSAMHQYLLNQRYISKAKLSDIMRFINETQLTHFIGYPSIMYALSSLAEEMGIFLENCNARYIFSGAEKMHDYQRKSLESVFSGIQCREFYSSSEEVASASTCINNRYHEDYELGHMELEHPEKVTDGVAGDLLLTGFQNDGMPFIRYQVGDSAVFASKEETCTCGFNGRLIKEITGRAEDYVITPEGARIKRFDYIFKDTSSVKECQIVQKRLGEVTYRIVRRPQYSEQVEKFLRKETQIYISPHIQVNFEYVDEIERTPAGKFKAVVSQLTSSQRLNS